MYKYYSYAELLIDFFKFKKVGILFIKHMRSL